MGRRLKTTIKFVPLICFSLAGLFAAFFSYVDYNHNYTYSYAEDPYAIAEFFFALFLSASVLFAVPVSLFVVGLAFLISSLSK